MKRFFKHHKPREALDAIAYMATGSQPAQKSRQPIDGQPVRTGSNFIAAPCPAWHSAEDHAVALLQWMQGPGGRVGEVPASELMQAHAEMCAEHWPVVLIRCGLFSF